MEIDTSYVNSESAIYVSNGGIRDNRLETNRIVNKIKKHFFESMRTQKKNPLRCSIKSYYSWYKMYMEPDPEIEEYFKQIDENNETCELIEQIDKCDNLISIYSREKNFCERKLRDMYP